MLIIATLNVIVNYKLIIKCQVSNVFDDFNVEPTEQQLWKHGYNLIPVAGGKPLVNWKSDKTNKKLIYTADRVKRFADKADGYAINTGNGVACIDIDCRDDAISSVLFAYAEKNFGVFGARMTNKPKLCLVVGYHEHEFNNVAQLLTPLFWGNENKHQVEISVESTPVTITGKHRKTNKPYYFHQNHDLNKIKSSELTKVKATHIENLLHLFIAACKRNNFTLKSNYLDIRRIYKTENNNSFEEQTNPNKKQLATKPTKKKKPPHTSNIAVDNDVTPAKRKDISFVLSNYKCHDYDEWLEVGIALFNEYNGAKKGIAAWDAWSTQCDNYSEGVCQKKWDTFSKTRDAKLTIAVLKNRLARELTEELDKYIDRFVFVKDGSLVLDLENGSVLKLLDFHNDCLNKSIKIPLDNGGTETIPISKAWMKNKNRKTAHGLSFFPVGDKIYVDNDTKLVMGNSYIKPEHDDISNQHFVDVFLKHIDYLFNNHNDNGVEFFMTWLAHLVQFPEERPTVTPLHISPHRGTGRGTLSEIITRVIGKTNVQFIKGDRLTESSGKNGFLSESLLIVVEEMAMDNKAQRYKLTSQLQEVLTGEWKEIDKKYGRQGMCNIFARVFMQSNDEIPVAIHEGDRRFNVYRSNKKPLSHDYYAGLKELVTNNDAIASIYNYLKNYNIAKTRQLLFKSTMTEAKRNMIANAQSTIDQSLSILSKLTPIVTREELFDFVKLYHYNVLGDKNFDCDYLPDRISKQVVAASHNFFPTTCAIVTPKGFKRFMQNSDSNKKKMDDKSLLKAYSLLNNSKENYLATGEIKTYE